VCEETAAYTLPVLQALLEKPQPLFAVVIAPTRELAVQVGEVVEALGATVGVKCAIILGGVDPVQQAIALARKPHIVVGTPGRLAYHLENTKGFSLRTCRFLVIDEADRLLGLDFEAELDKVLAAVPRDTRQTLLFSATMTTKVAKLQRASLRDPVKVQVNAKYKTVDTLRQTYLFVPYKYRDTYLVYLLNEAAGQACIVFCAKRLAALRLSYMLRNLGFSAVPLTGNMTQPKRLGALDRFKAGERSVLVATDVASRGLDIPSVDLVVNYDVPSPRDYIHRVGRTARAGKAGRAVTIVTQYSVEQYQRVEANIGKKLPLEPAEEAHVLVFLPRVADALRIATVQLKEAGFELSEARARKQRGGDDKGNAASLLMAGPADGADDVLGDTGASANVEGDDDDIGELTHIKKRVGAGFRGRRGGRGGSSGNRKGHDAGDGRGGRGGGKRGGGGPPSKRRKHD